MDIQEYERLSDPARWEQDVEARIKQTRTKQLKRPTFLLGSSTFVMWNDIETSLGLSNAANLSFGGSTVFDILYYLDELVLKFSPGALIVCSGDNDLARGRRPLMVSADCRLLAKYVWHCYPDTKIGFVSVKASVARWEFKKEQDELNRLVEAFCQTDSRLAYLDVVPGMTLDGRIPPEDLFLEDGLHLSEKGYRAWKEALLPQLDVFMKRA